VCEFRYRLNVRGAHANAGLNADDESRIAQRRMFSYPNNLHAYEKPDGLRSLALHSVGTSRLDALAVNPVIYRTRIVPFDRLIS
jgi:hypothetical protein